MVKQASKGDAGVVVPVAIQIYFESTKEETIGTYILSSLKIKKNTHTIELMVVVKAKGGNSTILLLCLR